MYKLKDYPSSAPFGASLPRHNREFEEQLPLPYMTRPRLALGNGSAALRRVSACVGDAPRATAVSADNHGPPLSSQALDGQPRLQDRGLGARAQLQHGRGGRGDRPG